MALTPGSNFGAFEITALIGGVLHEVRLAHMAPGFSVSADGMTILIAGVAEIGQDLSRIENFR